MFSENKRESKAPKFNSGVLSQINSMNAAGNRRSGSPFDPYASDSSDYPAPLMKFLRSVDPPPAFLTPVKVEEDVIVMDGISVPNSNKGSGEVRLRLPLMPSNSLNCRFVKSNSNSTAYKNSLCHYWETSHTCQFGSQCEFAHGKEELRHHRFSGKTKLEISKPNSSFEGSSDSSPSPCGSELNRNSHVRAAAAEAEGEEAFSMPPLSPIPAEEISGTSTVPDTTMLVSDWTPRTDGIKVSLPCVDKSPSKEDVGAYMENVLYGAKVK
ncbi:zinc finger CCCH domain-containing protein 24-like [Salvia splendens]|uniref:zinc finger CCCH domain-containing protein 24-like n=1 Tax=Salvia splendens TaxID=180675 RepID=UPI001C26EA7C|nr:zinc finger CCCH domain-containing protein 24-like [Salvia splendens]